MELESNKSSLEELYKELEYWQSYSPNSMASSMMRGVNVNQAKNSIRERIDLKEVKDYLLYKDSLKKSKEDSVLETETKDDQSNNNSFKYVVDKSLFE